MDWTKELFDENEKPLDRLVQGYSNTSVFRTIAFVGDSLSSGEFETRDENGKPGFHDLFEYSWGQHIARNNSLKGYNFSRGGITAKEYMESFAEQKGFWDKDKACQAYVIALGINDLVNYHMEMGTVDDICRDDYTQNAKTVLGYYAQIVSRYKEISPDAKFFFVTIPNQNEWGEATLSLFAERLHDLAEFFDNCYVIDLYKYGPAHDDEFKKRYFLYGHLNPSGYVLAARIIDSYIDYIVRHDPDGFKNVGFIGTDIKYK